LALHQAITTVPASVDVDQDFFAGKVLASHRPGRARPPHPWPSAAPPEPRHPLHRSPL